jgi:hypothetical protein
MLPKISDSIIQRETFAYRAPTVGQDVSAFLGEQFSGAGMGWSPRQKAIRQSWQLNRAKRRL